MEVSLKVGLEFGGQRNNERHPNFICHLLKICCYTKYLSTTYTSCDSTLDRAKLRMNKTLKSVFFLCVFTITSGCWKDMEGWRGAAVWSDDDTSVMGIYEYFEGRNTPTHLRKRNIESEIFLMT